MSYLSLDPDANTPYTEAWRERTRLFHEESIARVNQVIAKHKILDDGNLGLAAEKILLMNASLTVKRRRFIELANTFNSAISEGIACRSGCNACCSLITYIYEYEAEAMSKASGRPFAKVPLRRKEDVFANAQQYFRQPCPFLQDGKCSVYAHRPMICRLHHTFNPDASQCDTSIPKEQLLGSTVYDPDCIETPYHALNQNRQPPEPWGAIQDFFPTTS